MIWKHVIFPAALFALLASAGTAQAHALGVECTLRGGRIEVEAFHDDGTPAVGARVTVKDGQGLVIGEGKTDGRGLWACPLAPAGSYRVTVNAGGGHVKEVGLEITAEQLASASEQRLSEGPTRGEFTAFPWLKVVLGLTIIGGFFLAAWLVARRRGQPA